MAGLLIKINFRGGAGRSKTDLLSGISPQKEGNQTMVETLLPEKKERGESVQCIRLAV